LKDLTSIQFRNIIKDINESINLYFVGLERPEVKPVEHALVDDRIGILKKPSCVEVGSSTFYKLE
jgi:putative transposase